MTPRTTQVSPFGRELRRWRHIRGMSQLELAAAAGSTPRYVSFVETGRSRPGRELVLRLADVLAIPVVERNRLLAAAGLAPAYPQRSLGSAALSSIEQVLSRVLAGHEPYPAWVVRHPLRFVAANQAAETFMPGLCDHSPEEIVDLWYGPGPSRERIRNWPDVLWAGISALRREASASDDPQVLALLRRALRHVEGVTAPTSAEDTDLPVVCPEFDIDGQIVRTISASMRFDTAVEVTASQLRVELMFPADDEADAFFRTLSATTSSSGSHAVRRAPA